MRARIKTQEVVGALKAAGFMASVLSRRERRPGFSVRQVNPGACMVEYHAWGLDVDTPHYHAESEKFAAVLSAAGFDVCRPFPDKSLLGVTKPVKAQSVTL